MLRESLDNYFVIAAVAVGMIPILIDWFYMIETAKGICITDYSVLKRYNNMPFFFSLVILVVLWVTSADLEPLLLNCFKALTIGWLITIVGCLAISAIAGTEEDEKMYIRSLIMPCIKKVVIMVAVLWLIH